MRGLRKVTITTALLIAALLPLIAAVSPEAAATPKIDKIDSTLPVAMAQPLAAVDGAPLVTVARKDGSAPALPEPGMIMLVGATLIGLGSLVRQGQRAKVKGQK